MRNPYFKFHDGVYTIINQQALPHREEYIDLVSVDDYFDAIKTLKIRGAPAIGVCAAYGVVSAVWNLPSVDQATVKANAAIKQLRQSRPTAVNLFHALNRMEKAVNSYAGNDINALREALLKQAQSIEQYEIMTCDKMAHYGSALIKPGMHILTHCNTGMLATPGIGTALGILYRAFEQHHDIHVYVPETRPLLQGSRLTAFELEKACIPYTLMTDNMRGHLFSRKKIDIVITGADRIAVNGDTANKIGTVESAIMADHYDKPFFVAAPISTFDFSIQSGNDIEIENRHTAEITHIGENPVSSASNAINPAFDVTPSTIISGIITEKGIIKPCSEDISLLQQ